MSTVYWPAINPVVTEEAGTRGGTHTGIDLAARVGDPVLAPFDGTVVFVGGDGASGWIGNVQANGEGKTIDIQRADGLIARLGHLSGYNVSRGQKVRGGDVVGFAGSTGFSTGPHIHWEMRWDRVWVGGNWINPRLYNPQVFKGTNGAIIIGEDFMKLAHTTDGTVWLVTESGWHGLPSMQYANLFKRVIVSDQTKAVPDKFHPAEVQMMNSIQRLIVQAAVNGVTIDSAKLLRAIQDALGDLTITANTEIDPKVLAQAMEEIVVPRVAEAIVVQAGQKMAA